MHVTLNNDKVHTIITECEHLIGKDNETIQNVNKVIGLFVATFPAVEFGLLHYHAMERQKTAALQENYGNFDSFMPITDNMKLELQWWVDNLPTQSREIVQKNPELTMTTDASNEGWGGATLGDERIGGRWTSVEKQHHINMLELLAVDLALKSFEDQIQGKYVQAYC